MTETAPQRLEPLTLPLFGERLIEASAGTGKTLPSARCTCVCCWGWAVKRRFPAADGRRNPGGDLYRGRHRGAARAYPRQYPRAAHRLRAGVSANPLFSALMAEIDDLTDAASQLLAAERQMDEAAIYTIHGFCQRMLTHNAFESGMLFEQTLVQDELPLRRQACADFWRRHCYPLPLGVARAVSQVERPGSVAGRSLRLSAR
ncbi:UvrD-helicase domain-containing protein [Serratia ureilytica]